MKMISAVRRGWSSLGFLTKALCLFVATAVALSVAVYVACPVSLVLVADEPRAADAIVVLGGDQGERTAKALELFKQGLAPRIVITGESKMEMVTNCFRTAGVPVSILTVETEAANTYQNAEFCKPILKQWNARTALLVTSWFHSRRALVTFQRRMPEVRFVSTPAPRQEGTDRFAKSWARIELWKLLGYGIVHGVPPWQPHQVGPYVTKQ
jgi:uncharacterized SAM-binding protein YcdF (DUF218 family)